MTVKSKILWKAIEKDIYKYSNNSEGIIISDWSQYIYLLLLTQSPNSLSSARGVWGFSSDFTSFETEKGQRKHELFIIK